jgi:hypothetical protein
VITEPGRVPIGRRAWIGDGRHGASLAPDGTIDWYASGGLTAAPDLWRLLDPAGPAVRVGPRRDSPAARRHLPAAATAYRDGTNVVETVTEGLAGRRLSVTDFMPWPGPGLAVDGRVIRLVRALSGPVEIEVEVIAGPARDPDGRRRVIGPSGSGLRLGDLLVTGPGRFEPAPLGREVERWRAVATLDAGEEVAVTVSALGGPSGRGPVTAGEARRLLEETQLAWRSWLSPLAYGGPYRRAVERAFLSMRALTGTGGAPSGAGTTSLPRRPGSERGADDRWVRLSDAAEAVGILAAAGLPEDAEATETWLRHTLTTAHLPWPAWFDHDGQPVPDAVQLPLEGWRRSQPVVAGRTRPAPDPALPGLVAAAVGASRLGPGGRSDEPGPLTAAFASLAGACEELTGRWPQPDSGRWEIERPLRRYTAGRLGAWMAFDRMARLARAANPLDLEAVGWQQESRDLFSWMEAGAVGADGGLTMDGTPGAPDEADAALLAVAWAGPWPATHPVVGATVDRVLERLGAGPFLYRYSDRVADERAGPDHPDLEASLLGAAALAHLGRWEEGHERLEAVADLVGRAGPGLLGETADPVAGELYGNFPSTRAALALARAAFALTAGPR